MNHPTLTMPPSALEQLGQIAAIAYPHECCGLLVGHQTQSHRTVTQIIPANNLADAPRLHDRYLIDPRIFLQTQRTASQQGLEILGCFHSHPNHPATPSETDAELAWDEFVYLILAVEQEGMRELRAWHFDKGSMNELEIVEE